jgi:hypothetical protein
MASDLADRILAVLDVDLHASGDVADKLSALTECVTQLLMLRLGDDRVTAQAIAESLAQRLAERVRTIGVDRSEFLS